VGQKGHDSKKIQKRWFKSVLHKPLETYRPDDNISYGNAQSLRLFNTELPNTHQVPEI
jgi:hypothetical protein